MFEGVWQADYLTHAELVEMASDTTRVIERAVELKTPEQLGQELDLILELMDFMMRSFGYTYKAYLATRPEKYLGTLEEWDRAIGELRAALERRDLDYEIDEGGGVFYAPKIDIKLKDALDRRWHCIVAHCHLLSS